MTYQLTVACTGKAALAPVPKPPPPTLMRGAWSASKNTAGGCPNNRQTVANNPQIVLSISKPTEVVLTLAQQELARKEKHAGAGEIALQSQGVNVTKHWFRQERLIHGSYIAIILLSIPEHFFQLLT